MTPLISMALAGCLAIAPGSDRVTAGDLARRYRSSERYRRIRRCSWRRWPVCNAFCALPNCAVSLFVWGWKQLPRNDVCVERQMAPLDPQELREIIGRQLQGADVVILDYSRSPRARRQDRISGCGATKDARGGPVERIRRLRPGRRLPIWAKIQAVRRAESSGCGRLGAGPRNCGSANPPGNRGRVSVTWRVCSLAWRAVAGKVTRRYIAAGAPIRREWIENPKDVERGDSVVAEARAGAASLKLDAVAEAAGSPGISSRFSIRYPSAVSWPGSKAKGRSSVEGGNP